MCSLEERKKYILQSFGHETSIIWIQANQRLHDSRNKRYRASTTKRPDFGEFLKIGKWFFSGLKGLLRTTGVQIST
jgi:hypothetical protein